LSDTPLSITNGEIAIDDGNSLAILGFGADHLTIQRTGGDSRFFYVGFSGTLAVTE